MLLIEGGLISHHNLPNCHNRLVNDQAVCNQGHLGKVDPKDIVKFHRRLSFLGHVWEDGWCTNWLKFQR